MNTRIILSVVVSLFVISLVVVVATNIENNQTLFERTEFEIYQDFLDSKKRERIIVEQISDEKIHGKNKIDETITVLEKEIILRKQLFNEYLDLKIQTQTELDTEISRIEKYGDIIEGNWLYVLDSINKIEHDSRITLKRFGCETCPIYSVSISGDGSVLFKGLLNVYELGRQEYVIPEEDVTELINLLYDQKYRNLKSQYGTEGPTSVITTIEIGDLKRITNYDNLGPEGLKQIEDKIDEITKTKQYVFG